MAEKTNHHIVPQFYLRSFANGVARRARFHVWEKATGYSFGANVRDVAAARNFNRIRAKDGEYSNALEDAMAEIEAEWAPQFREVVEAGAFPTPKHRESILTLAATLSLRSGRFREAIQSFTARTHMAMGNIMLSSKERWEAAHPNAEVPYEELKRFWDSREFDLTYEQTAFIGHELEMIDPVYELLDHRNWRFVRPGGRNRFITSDDPAVLHWTEERDRGFWRSPGHGVGGTSLTFPLSPELLIFGTFEPQPPEHGVFSDFEVGQVNGLIAGHARRHFFALDTAFSIGMQGIGVVPATEIARLLRSKRK